MKEESKSNTQIMSLGKASTPEWRGPTNSLSIIHYFKNLN